MQHRHTRKSAVRLAGAALAAALSLGLAAAASADQLQDILAARSCAWPSTWACRPTA